MTTTKRTLSDISDNLAKIIDLLERFDGDLDEAEAALLHGGEEYLTSLDVDSSIDLYLEDLTEERNDKLNAYAYLIRSLEAEANTIKAEIDRLRKRKASRESKVERLKDRLRAFLDRHNESKVETGIFTFAMQKTGGKPKVILNEYFVENAVELPEQFRRVKFEADLNAIRESLLKSEIETLQYATLEDPDRKHLRIR